MKRTTTTVTSRALRPIELSTRTSITGKLWIVAGLLSAVGSGAWAQTINANATISGIQAGVNYDYTITLNNTAASTSPIETLWYAWVPGADFLPSSPITVQPPSGWTDTITGGGPNDGYAIEFVTSSAPLNPGSSLLFQFESADTPAQLAGDSPTHPGTPVGTSVLYAGSPFVGASQTLVVQSVPEPSSLGLLLVAGVILGRAGWKSRPILKTPR